MMQYVRWSEYVDRKSRRLVDINGSLYPVELAAELARQIQELLKDYKEEPEPDWTPKPGGGGWA